MKRILELAKEVLNEVDDIQKSDINTINNTQENNTSQTPIQKFINSIKDESVKQKIIEINGYAPMGGCWYLNKDENDSIWFNLKGRWIKDYIEYRKELKNKDNIDLSKPNKNTVTVSKDGKPITTNTTPVNKGDNKIPGFTEGNGLNLSTVNTTNKKTLIDTIKSINLFKDRFKEIPDKQVIVKSLKLPTVEDIEFIIEKKQIIGGLTNDMLQPVQQPITIGNTVITQDNLSESYNIIMDEVNKTVDIDFKKLLNKEGDLTPNDLAALLNELKKRLANSKDIKNSFGHKLSPNNIKIAYYFSNHILGRDVTFLQTPNMWMLYYNRYVKPNAKGIPLSVPKSQAKLNKDFKDSGSFGQSKQTDTNSSLKDEFGLKLYYDIIDTELFDNDVDPYLQLPGIYNNLTGEVNNLAQQILEQKNEITSNAVKNNKYRDLVYLDVLNKKLNSETTNLKDGIKLFHSYLVEEFEDLINGIEVTTERDLVKFLIHITLAENFYQYDLEKELKLENQTTNQMSESTLSIFGTIFNNMKKYLNEIDNDILMLSKENPKNKKNYQSLNQNIDVLSEIENNNSKMNLKQVSINDILQLAGVKIIDDNDNNLMEIKNNFYNILNKIK